MSDPTLAYVAAIRERNALRQASEIAWKAGNHAAFCDLDQKRAEAHLRVDVLGRELDRFLKRGKRAA